MISVPNKNKIKYIWFGQLCQFVLINNLDKFVYIFHGFKRMFNIELK